MEGKEKERKMREKIEKASDMEAALYLVGLLVGPPGPTASVIELAEETAGKMTNPWAAGLLKDILREIREREKRQRNEEWSGGNKRGEDQGDGQWLKASL
ncbi:MAG: hypothetical protein JRH13_06135 [Deltaproteobacteria bacterium]|nr:hypothetical protein [Deltaproteobacteria bacterium]MBW2018213.1 hypothetical protein [Deltaproteobacteria bacterium]MBW2128925.1 hypothetical protein [Deltaproteobacteria bacterium]MBW2304148.1 hypothetical protein [Deltaproteobacteria bacterium]